MENRFKHSMALCGGKMVVLWPRKNRYLTMVQSYHPWIATISSTQAFSLCDSHGIVQWMTAARPTSSSTRQRYKSGVIAGSRWDE